MTDRMRIKVEENTEQKEEMRQTEKECRRNKGTEKERKKKKIITTSNKTNIQELK